jgi:hypothetical protein
MTSLATNSRNDLYVGSDGNLAVARGLAAVIQDCEHVMKAQLGEMIFATQRGVPTFGTIWNRWNPVQFEAYGRRMLLTVANVVAVTIFDIERDGDTARYAATIRTTFGETQISGTIDT